MFQIILLITYIQILTFKELKVIINIIGTLRNN